METNVTIVPTVGRIQRSAARARSFPLAAHAAFLFVVLAALMPVVGTTWLYQADEGAVLAQVQILDETGEWVAPPVFRDVGVEQLTFDLSTSTSDGFAPFAKHPIYPTILRPFMSVLGVTGAVLVSVLGTTFAAWGAARVLGESWGGLERITMWTVGVASPLIFDAYLVIAHSLGAATVAWGTLYLLRLKRRPSFGTGILAVALLFIGGLLRNEVVLLGAAVTMVSGVRQLRRRHWRAVALTALPLGAVTAAYLFDPILARLVVGESQETFAIATGSSDAPWLTERFLAFVITVLLPSYSDFGVGAALALLVPVCLLVLVMIMTRRPQDHGGMIILVMVAAVAAFARLVIGPPQTIPGLLIAFPIVAGGLLAVRRMWPLLPDDLQDLTVVCVVFGGAVMATQYATGGSGEWGARYLAVGIPLLVPPVVAALSVALSEIDRNIRIGVVAGVVAASLCISGSGIWVLRSTHDVTEAVVEAARQAQVTSDADAVVSPEGALARANWRHALDDRWLSVRDRDAVVDVVADLHDGGVTTVLVVWRGSNDEPWLDPGVETVGIAGGGWKYAILGST